MCRQIQARASKNPAGLKPKQRGEQCSPHPPGVWPHAQAREAKRSALPAGSAATAH